MLEELEDQVERGTPAGKVEDRGDGGHGERVEGHPAGGVGLLEPATDREMGPVDRADVVQPQEPAFEQVGAVGVLAVHPPGEVHQQLVEHPAEEVEVPGAVDGEHLERRPGLHGGLTSPKSHS